MRRRVCVLSPCVTDARMVMAEVVYERGRGGDVFPPKLLCERLAAARAFSSVKCSVKLGIACFGFGGVRVLVNKSGKIVVRKARSEAEAVSAADYVARLLLSCGSLKV